MIERIRFKMISPPPDFWLKKKTISGIGILGFLDY
jgi:hypothetical protein